MPSDEHDTSADVPNVASDDTQPVRPASRVRVLLGLPDDAGENLVFSSPVPPVGFRYTEDRFSGEPDPIDPSLIEHGLQDVLMEDAPFPPSMEETDIDTPGVSGRRPGNIGAEETRRNEERTRHIASQLEPAPPEHPIDALQQARHEIPGVSARATAFPPFSDEAAAEPTGNASEPRVPAASPPPATLPPPDVLPKSQSKPPLAAEPASGTSEHPVDAPQQTRLEIPGVSDRPTAFPPFADEMAAEQTLDRVPSTEATKAPMIPPVRTPERSQQRAETVGERLTGTSSQPPPAHAVTGDGHVVSSAGSTPRNNGFSPGSLRSVGLPTGRISENNTADERIEQLQQTVYELTSKLFSLQAQVNNQAQREQRHAERAHSERSAGRPEPTPPPPPRPVVIIKRSAHQDRPPHAFWARRYLGRLHHRPLR